MSITSQIMMLAALAISLIVIWLVNASIKKKIPDKNKRKKWKKDESIGLMLSWLTAPLFLLAYLLSSIVSDDNLFPDSDSMLDKTELVLTIAKWAVVFVTFGFAIYFLKAKLELLDKLNERDKSK